MVLSVSRCERKGLFKADAPLRLLGRLGCCWQSVVYVCNYIHVTWSDVHSDGFN